MYICLYKLISVTYKQCKTFEQFDELGTSATNSHKESTVSQLVQ